MRLNPQTLPSNDNISRFAFCMDVNGEAIVRRGKMVACYGNLRYEAMGSSMLSMATSLSFNAPSYRAEFMAVTGQGKLVLGDNGNDIASYNVENATFTLKADHVLAYQNSLKCQESTLPGYVTLIGTGQLIASSNGPVIFLEPPARVDPDAVLGWADMPSPSYRYDFAYARTLLGLAGSLAGMSTSGEEKQLDFYGQGTILVQSGEEPLVGRSDIQTVLASISGMHQNELVQVSQAIAARLSGR